MEIHKAIDLSETGVWKTWKRYGIIRADRQISYVVPDTILEGSSSIAELTLTSRFKTIFN